MGEILRSPSQRKPMAMLRAMMLIALGMFAMSSTALPLSEDVTMLIQTPTGTEAAAKAVKDAAKDVAEDEGKAKKALDDLNKETKKDEEEEKKDEAEAKEAEGDENKASTESDTATNEANAAKKAAEDAKDAEGASEKK